MTQDDLLTSWRDAEDAAVEAELAVARMGQTAADPRAAELLARAQALREQADRLLAELLLQSGARRRKAGPDNPQA